MEYIEIKPYKKLESFIHSYWELKAEQNDRQWERNFPDGCAGLVLNLGDSCITDNGSVSMEFGKTYVVGAMTTFKDSFIDNNTHLMGVCFKPGSFTNFYEYVPQNELTNITLELEKSNSFNIDKVLEDPLYHFNKFFTDRVKANNTPLQALINDIHSSKGKLSISELSKRNCTTVRQLERTFKARLGISPKEYSNIIRFQNALNLIKNADESRSLQDIAFESGFYDHAHLSKEIKRNTGLSPSQL